MYRICLLMGLLAVLGHSSFAQGATKTICVFDPIGKSGDVFVTAQDLSSDFLSLGVNFKLQLYLDEKKAKHDFKIGVCDGAILTGLHAREFNRFAASLEAPGIITDYANIEQILAILASEKAASYMRQGHIEIAGVYPAGAVYMVINDRSRATLKGLRGLRMINIDDNDDINAFARRVGAKLVPGNTNNFARLFKDDKVDITFAPVAVLQAVELDKAVAQGGGIPDVPISLLTLQLLINSDRFPEGFGQAARELSLTHSERVLGMSQRAQLNIPKRLWISTLPERDRWARLALSVREEMIQRGHYHPKMIKILDQLRCGTDRILEGC